jgi:NSS family neurotransmitter:Na+ symporter
MDLEDFLVSNIILPLGSFIYVLFVTLPGGWGFKHFLEEANSGKGLKFPAKARPYMTFVLPVIILVLFVVGLRNFF